MSRTTKGKKAAGFEYLGRRPGNNNGAVPGPFTKKVTHHRERQQGVRICRKESEG